MAPWAAAGTASPATRRGRHDGFALGIALSRSARYLRRDESIKKPRPGLGFEDGAKRTRTADPLHAMKQDASLRAILLQRSWVIVALCFEWNRAQAGGPLHQSGPLQALLVAAPWALALV